RQDELADTEPYGARAARKREDHALVHDPGARTREDGVRADLVPRKTAERFAEAHELLLVDLAQGLVGVVPGRYARAARDDEGVRRVVGRCRAHELLQEARLLLENHVTDVMDAAPHELLDERPTGFVVRSLPCVAHRYGKDSNLLPRHGYGHT